ncbi:MAG: phenylacetate-CoA oxygenase/reductase subunit PaaK [Flavobacteriales bacterium]|jgi:ring-1,2-phenylacetyl-CoA epoxidase subunit PaaE|nr:phenylacetate-CoA oxygenase/reductase subunit PaaK [Flavobacteriales bacterium]MBK7247879.1 phenylacetate-CoA oxygenase/reductase subunit PaaK [Flavobacteriales bacterium]MBK9598943.1 phenylacetate-CoA oxygenase/reductase subunit PaaK [Flavobacteriales bacterium]QQS73148.1 MAG: phenylacetate-CoA oxygenase/reductase subunit PaaK [Flavobacteriales bacterium]HQV39379.1 phenylacetate-CoA oxygenase/reductase subunit PaaK [Flavobacteriales bacterium]
MARFHTLEVADIHHETADSISIGFRVPPELKADFSFIHGQYLTLKLIVNGTELRRSYSICSSPLDPGEIRIAVKKVDGGRASTQLVEQLKPGSKLEVMSPMGNFHTALDPAQEHHYIAFAAGSGITPILSILTTVLRTEHKSKFTLFFGNSDVDRIIFRKKLDELKVHYPDRLNVFHILSRGNDVEALFNGRITNEKAVNLLKAFVNDPLHKEFFICGPEQMMVNVSEALERSGVEKKHIHVELFTTPVTSEPKKPETPASSGGEVPLKGKARVKIILDGNETEIEVGAKGDSILDTAEAAGLDVPYACKGAVCCTCKARIVEGKVAMDMNYALTDEEVEDGYVLTCQSHPLTERVVVDYDQH